MDNNDPRYLETMRYPNMLAMCINNINFAQQKGFSGFNECLTLFTTMKSDILGATTEQIETIIEGLKTEQIKINEQVEWHAENKAKFKWSQKHRRSVKSQMMNDPMRIAVHKMKTILINQIDKKKLLITTEKDIPKGFEGTY